MHGNLLDDVLTDAFFGVTAHPRLVGLDLKHFFTCHVAAVLWPLFIISAFYHHKAKFELVNGECLLRVLLQCEQAASWPAPFCS